MSFRALILISSKLLGSIWDPLYGLYIWLLLSFYCFTFVCSFILRLLLSKISLLIFPILDFEIHAQTKVNQLKDFSNTGACFSNLLIVRTKNSYLSWYLILKVFILPLAKTCLLKYPNFKKVTEIADEDISLIMQAWKTLSSNVDISWGRCMLFSQKLYFKAIKSIF